MKLIAFSDPHLDIQTKRGYPNFLEKLNDYLHILAPDVILVTGDIAGNTSFIHKFLEGITITVKKKIFCPGNHDIWVNSQAHDASWVKYYQILPELSKELGWHYLPNQPISIDNVAFVGTMGWYDYSTRNPIWDDKINYSHYANKINKDSGAVWMDREFARFGNDSDKTIADHFASELIYDLKQISEDIFSKKFESNLSSLKQFNIFKNSNIEKFDNVDTVVIGTHIVPFSNFVKFTGNLDWDFFSAYIGNTTLGRIIRNINDNLRRISVFGHTHFPQRRLLEHNLEAICSPIGYPHEWGSQNSILEEVFQSRIASITI